ncbi:OLC1v1010307C1 [Oldenlandia corymbosa var. corymbosa]|uniref:OLC1v1010307C1 n=1 Tax=Oldenlandia corymbosa var. corymbosa TaxID=529605 RepID=A0AAV1DR33_OLDCO|nr:OLC1v1010307C1 [Oldenlandia corymbosa var. corymbosa]
MMMSNNYKLVLFSCFLVMSLNQAFASSWFQPINLSPVTSESPKISSPTPPLSANSPPSPQNSFSGSTDQPTWDDMVETVARGIFFTVRDTMKAYEDTYKCGTGNHHLGYGTPGAIIPPSLSPPTISSPSPNPEPPTIPSPSPNPEPNNDGPSPSPGSDGPSPYDDTPTPSPSPSISPDISPSPNPSPDDYSPTPSPSILSPTSPLMPPPGPTPRCIIKHVCKCECDKITYRGYSCHRNTPCWCNCVSKHTVNSEPLIPISSIHD